MNSSSHNEDYWVRSFRKKKDGAVAYFFDIHYKPLCYFANRLVGDSTVAEEVVSDCFVKLWNSDYAIKTADSIKAFLYISCKNACFDYMRQAKNKSRLQLEYLHQRPLSEEGAHLEIVRSEVLAILDSEIRTLPTSCQRVFRLFFLEEKKTSEVMDLLNMNEKAVRYQKAKALKLLKSKLLKKGLDEGLYLVIIAFFLGRH